MSVSVIKSGPYFSSGPIKWSDLRTYFKETSTGTISASYNNISAAINTG